MIGALFLSGCADGFDRKIGKAGTLVSVTFRDNIENARKLPPSGTDWKSVREQPANGSDFAANLSRDYKSLMLFEADEMYDEVSADMYAQRALATAKGDPVGPVELKNFYLPESHLGAIRSARADMEGLFSRGATTRFPQQAARLQSSFDCWVEQQEENHQPDHIAACRDQFVENYKRLTASMESAQAQPAPAPAAPAPAPAQTFKDSYTVFFAFDSDKLDATASATVAEVIQALQAQNAGASIIGHADTSGPRTYNLSLSQRRAKAISDRLLNAGIRPAVVTTEGRGETDLAVPTADNVREQRNRRAIINIR